MKRSLVLNIYFAFCNCNRLLVIAVEINKEKAQALKERLNSLNIQSKIQVIPRDINNCIKEVILEIEKEKSISYIIIDPEGYEGLYWSTIEPFLTLKGDMMLNWFEHDIWRIRGAAVSDETNEKVKESHSERLNELFGNDNWKRATSSSELTQLFIDRLLLASENTLAEIVTIPRTGGDFKLILLTSGSVKKQAEDWANQVSRRIHSLHGKEISKLLDVKAGRLASLDEF